MTWLQAAIDNAELIIDWCWDFIITNAFCQMLLVISIIPLGFRVFRNARQAVGAESKNE